MESITTPRAMGAAIARLRHAKGLTQAQVAQQAGVSRQLVNRLEMGTAEGIMFDKLLAILAALDCTLFVGHDSEDAVSQQETSPVRHHVSQPVTNIELPSSYFLDDSLFAPTRKDA
jgi:transcriptional regulator with XRE-family HTH domain